MKKGLYKHPGLVASLVAVLGKDVGKEGGEWKNAWEDMLMVMKNISYGDKEVKKGLYEFPDLMLSLEKHKEQRGDVEFTGAQAQAAAIIAIIVHSKTDDWVLPPSKRKCWECDKVRLSGKKNLLKCSRCLRARYCDRSCQKKHWKCHKAECAEMTTKLCESIGGDVD